MVNKTEPIIVPVDQETIDVYDHFNDLVNTQGTEELKTQWNGLEMKLKEHLQIEGPLTPGMNIMRGGGRWQRSSPAELGVIYIVNKHSFLRVS